MYTYYSKFHIYAYEFYMLVIISAFCMQDNYKAYMDICTYTVLNPSHVVGAVGIALRAVHRACVLRVFWLAVKNLSPAAASGKRQGAHSKRHEQQRSFLKCAL